jgi:hypothetical protein
MMPNAINESSKVLCDRLVKELERSKPESGAAPTARVGGWARMGAALDGLLRGCLVFICDADRLNVEDELRRSVSGAARLDRASAGQLARVLRDLSRSPAASKREVAMICRDLLGGNRSSKLWTLVEVRNRAIHDGATEPSRSETQTVLRGALDVLRAHRAAAGWEPTK